MRSSEVPPTAERYVCVHGHFYQPPRENPWLEAIEQQPSAHPYHDWNERITAECYAPNAFARVLDERDRVASLINNYSRMSFNFGPTLLSWLEVHSPRVYSAVLEADKESAARFGGHGSAMAQAYSHMIMPLANERDRTTQVAWGVLDFEHRFGRSPEGMWLPETAADLASLDALASAGILFTVLAPRQADKVRKLGATGFSDASGGRIDPSMPYQVSLPSGRTIAVFFYDGPIAQGVAFEGLLHRGEHFAGRLGDAFDRTRKHPELAHIATDGETYGHHHRHGEMALAYALQAFERSGTVKLTNYRQFLAAFPPTHEVVIHERSSWSCVHGVGRWSSDCGCNGGRPGWNQRWRGPLRAALDGLREALIARYEEHAGALLRDPWAARDAYLAVVLDRRKTAGFLAAQARRGLSSAEGEDVVALLEMQRHAMLMYTSCGWFFDELSGLEPVQILTYAARALELGERFKGPELRSPFLTSLALAKSNVAEAGDGRKIFESAERAARVDLSRVTAHHAISAFFSRGGGGAVSGYTVVEEARQGHEVAPARIEVGRARVASRVLGGARHMTYGVIGFGDARVNAGVCEDESGEIHARLAADIAAEERTADIPGLLRALDRHLGGLPYTTSSLFRDEQRRVLSEIAAPAARDAGEALLAIHARHAHLIRLLSPLGADVPTALSATAAYALNAELGAVIASDEPDPGVIAALVARARAEGVTIEAQRLGYEMTDRVKALAHALGDEASLVRLGRLVSLARALPFSVSLWEAQNALLTLVTHQLSTARARAASGDPRATRWLAELDRLAASLNVKIPT